jgi:uncharacterized OB-fold protein
MAGNISDEIRLRVALPTRGRPRPRISRDTAFFWEGLELGELRIQRFTICSKLRHPPGPMCPSCRSFEWDYVLSAGRGVVHSFTIPHRPLVHGFDQPTAVVLVALEEGVRILSNLDATPAMTAIGTPVEVFYLRQAEGFTVHQFRTISR